MRPVPSWSRATAARPRCRRAPSSMKFMGRAAPPLAPDADERAATLHRASDGPAIRGRSLRPRIRPSPPVRATGGEPAPSGERPDRGSQGAAAPTACCNPAGACPRIPVTARSCSTTVTACAGRRALRSSGVLDRSADRTAGFAAAELRVGDARSRSSWLAWPAGPCRQVPRAASIPGRRSSSARAQEARNWPRLRTRRAGPSRSSSIEIIASRPGRARRRAPFRAVLQRLYTSASARLVEAGTERRAAAWRRDRGSHRPNDPRCRGVLLLGLDAGSRMQLVAGPSTCARHAIVHGFAIGRTIFGPPARDWFAGRIDDATAIARIAASYERMIEAWRRARPAAVG